MTLNIILKAKLHLISLQVWQIFNMNHFPDMSNRTRNRSKKVQCRYVVIFKKRKEKEKKEALETYRWKKIYVYLIQLLHSMVWKLTVDRSGCGGLTLTYHNLQSSSNVQWIDRILENIPSHMCRQTHKSKLNISSITLIILYSIMQKCCCS